MLAYMSTTIPAKILCGLAKQKDLLWQ